MTSRPSFDEQSPTRQPQSNHGAGQTAGLRAVAALLATGGFALLAGAVFLLPFAFSPYAIQNDVYMSNFFLAPLFILAGGVCVLAGLVGVTRLHGAQRHARRLGARALLLALTGATVVAVASFILGGRYESMGPTAINWPPYLTMPLLGFALAVGLVVCVVALVWGASAPGQIDQPEADQSGSAGAAPL